MPDDGHVHTWDEVGAHLAVAFTIDAYGGVTDAVIECDCGRHALLNLLDWLGPNLDKRVYAVSESSTEATAVFLRNMRSDYCDLTRKAAEVNALAAAASPVTRVLGLRLPALQVIATMQANPRRPIWREDLIEPGATGWHTRLGLEVPALDGSS